MKKRIGTRIYDTEASRLIAVTAGSSLYQKKTREMEFFRVDRGEAITSMTDDDARAFCADPDTHVLRDPQFVRAQGRGKNCSCTVMVDRQTHAAIQTYAAGRMTAGRMTAGEAVKEILISAGILK